MELTGKSYEEMTVREMRGELCRLKLGAAGWRATVGQAEALAVLKGERPAPTVAGAAPAAGSSSLGAMIAAEVQPYLEAHTISKEDFETLADGWAEQAATIKAQAESIAALTARLDAGDFTAKGGGAALTVFNVSDVKLGEVPGPVHRQLSEVVAWVAAGCSVWLWGSPGWGKTTIGYQIGAALGLPATVIPVDPTMTPGKLLGFKNMATGEFVEGFLFKPYRDGGVVLLDEIDTGDAGVLAALNSLLANDRYLFPNGETVARHPNFRVIAGANTKGDGSVAGFTARVRLDAATLDRFAVLELKADNGLEFALVTGEASDSVPWQGGKPLTAEAAKVAGGKWCRWVQAVRAKVGAAVLVGPRASYIGARAIAAGIPVDQVADACVFKLAAADTRANILRACGTP